MTRGRRDSRAGRPPVRTQVSAGGAAVRGAAGAWEVALVLVGPAAKPRWQLPKGLVEENETPEAAAIREVREEAGVETELVAPLDRVEYWYQATEPGGGRVRYHKFVHFFLLRYIAGDVGGHDREVREARWVPIDQAAAMLAFASERRVVERAAGLLALPALAARAGRPSLSTSPTPPASPAPPGGRPDRGSRR